MMVYPQDRFTRENHRALDHIFQFSDIARPGIANQPLERFLVNILARTAEFHAAVLKKMSSQNGNVLRAIPQWRQPDRKDIQTIKEIGAKRTVFDGSV